MTTTFGLGVVNYTKGYPKVRDAIKHIGWGSGSGSG